MFNSEPLPQHAIDTLASIASFQWFALGLCLLFFVMIIIERVKPDISFNKSLFAIWFYSHIAFVGLIAYKIYLSEVL